MQTPTHASLWISWSLRGELEKQGRPLQWQDGITQKPRQKFRQKLRNLRKPRQFRQKLHNPLLQLQWIVWICTPS